MTLVHTDCPPCPRCGIHCGTTTSGGRGPVASGWLRCCACGHRWEATPAELAQAVAADQAWAQKQAREERRDA
jgi:transcription elongation factor Elf1